MKIIASAFLAIVAIALIMAVGVGTSWFGLYVSRPLAKYAKETDRQVYMNSVAHQQGADSGIGIDCANMRNVGNPSASRHAFAGLVIQDAASYGGNAELSPASSSCVQDANALLAQPIQ